MAESLFIYLTFVLGKMQLQNQVMATMNIDQIPIQCR